MSVSVKQNKLFYEIDAKFKIIPDMCQNDIKEFNVHIDYLKKTYSTDRIDCFFWKFDDNTNCIVINEDTDVVEHNIFNQILNMAIWLFNNDYYINGSFCCRTENIIEYILMDGKTKFMIHNILLDTMDIADLPEEIIPDAKTKIFSHNKNNHSSPNSKTFHKIIINDGVANKYNHVNKPVSYIVNHLEDREENKMIIETLQERLTHTENKLKLLTRNNKFIWKICSVIGVFTVGSLMAYIYMKENNRIPPN
jgi:hypothetical protein